MNFKSIKCADCHTVFTPKASCQIRCPKCQNVHRKKRMAEYNREYRKRLPKKSDAMPDKFCEFCGGKIPRTGQNWWTRIACDREECQEKKLAYQQKHKFKGENFEAVKNDEAPNGWKCRRCGCDLFGDARFYCKQCHTIVCDTGIRLDGEYLFESNGVDSKYFEMGAA